MTRKQRAQRLRGIYAIVNEGAQCDVIGLADAMLSGGIRMLQYRAKRGIVAEHAHELRRLTRAYDALFILNDAWAAVQQYDADGVHIGPDDAHESEREAVRAALHDRVLGISCGTPAEAQSAERLDADYIGVGSVYATTSKADAGEPIGVRGLRAVCAACTLPAAAIGGITLDSIPEIRATGVAMAAVISAVCAAPDAKAASRALVERWSA